VARVSVTIALKEIVAGAGEGESRKPPPWRRSRRRGKLELTWNVDRRAAPWQSRLKVFAPRLIERPVRSEALFVCSRNSPRGCHPTMAATYRLVSCIIVAIFAVILVYSSPVEGLTAFGKNPNPTHDKSSSTDECKLRWILVTWWRNALFLNRGGKGKVFQGWGCERAYLNVEWICDGMKRWYPKTFTQVFNDVDPRFGRRECMLFSSICGGKITVVTCDWRYKSAG